MDNNIQIENKKNYLYINYLSLTIFITILLNFINIGLMVVFNIQNTKIVTFFVYAIVLFFSMLTVYKNNDFTIKKILIYFLFLLFFQINHIFFKNSRNYLSETNMFLIYLFFLPISIFIIGSISNWDYFTSVFSKYARYAIILGTLSIVFFGISDYIDYMQFSYSLLPFILVLYYSFRKNGTTIDFIFFIIGFIDIIVFGARATILFSFAFILIYEFLFFLGDDVLNKIFKLSFFCFAGFVLLILSTNIKRILELFAELTGSRFLTKLFEHQILKSTARNLIYSEAIEAIKKMGFRIYGLFGDRMVVNSTYVHNIFLEFLLSFGIVFGSIFIIILLSLIFKATIFKSDTNLRFIATLFTFAFFLRFLISGSFVIEGNFYLYVAIILNINNINIPYGKEEINNEYPIYSG